jgi:hypothetical protein
LKRFFVLKNEILLKKDNLNYLSGTNNYFDDIHTSTTTSLSKRTDESLQLELSYIDKD